MYNKTIIEFGFRMISWIIKTEVCVICRSRIFDIMLNLIQKLFIITEMILI